jgi:hypothetical protein
MMKTLEFGECMFREEIKKAKAKMLIQNSKDLELPEFLRLLRRIEGKTRRIVSQETLISPSRLEYLERGKNERMPEEDELMTLGGYYGVPIEMLRKKAKRYHK